MAWRKALVCGGLVLSLLFAASAEATNSDAPAGALPNWLPNEQWVYNHWLPYDEQRLYHLLNTDRGGIWRYLRDDTSHDLAQLGRRRGFTPQRLATSLVAPQARRVSAAQAAVLRARALRTLTQGHLSQHLLFHSLHQKAILDQARRIFGVRRAEFVRLRMTDLSPLDIAHLYGHDVTLVRRRAASALRGAVRRGVRAGDISRDQGRILLDRQLRQLPRWLGQRRNNGPPPWIGPSTPLLPSDKAQRNASDVLSPAALTTRGLLLCLRSGSRPVERQRVA